MSPRLLASCLCLAACSAPSHRPTDGGSPDAAAASVDAAVAVDGASAPCAFATDGGVRTRVLACHQDCADTMFAPADVVEEFDDPAEYAAHWSGSYVAPVVAGGSLVFGPHPLTASWWENYSPTQTVATFGDTLLCVKWKQRPGAQGANGFQLSLRGGSEGMVLGVSPVDGIVVLTTKVSASDQWMEHARAPFHFPVDQSHRLEAILWASGDHYVAEVHDLDTGEIAALDTTYTLPAQGPASLLGWQLENALYVDRVVIGTPASDVLRELADPGR